MGQKIITSSFSGSRYPVKTFQFVEKLKNVKKCEIVNAWLRENNVLVHKKEIKGEYFLNTYYPGKWETSMRSLYIPYGPSNIHYRYYFDCISVRGWLKYPQEKLDAAAQMWLKEHPRNRILWQHKVDHSTTKAEFMSTFFLFTIIE